MYLFSFFIVFFFFFLCFLTYFHFAYHVVALSSYKDLSLEPLVLHPTPLPLESSLKGQFSVFFLELCKEWISLILRQFFVFFLELCKELMNFILNLRGKLRCEFFVDYNCRESCNVYLISWVTWYGCFFMYFQFFDFSLVVGNIIFLLFLHTCFQVMVGSYPLNLDHCFSILMDF